MQAFTPFSHPFTVRANVRTHNRFLRTVRTGLVTSLLLSTTVMLTASRAAPRNEVRPRDRQPSMRSRAATSDSADVVRAIAKFRGALASGDSLAALALLSQDVVILESGSAEHLAEYRRHHLPADIEFARAISGVPTLVSAQIAGNVAWVSTTTVTRGEFKARAVNSAGAELLVLTRASAGTPWRIRAIHWSSHRIGS